MAANLSDWPVDERAAETVIVGAGPAGLAAAACLRRLGRTSVMFEQGPTLGSSWRRHYERLHLHTDSRHSCLPYLPFPRGTPRYPSRNQVIAYLEAYARHFELRPQVGETVRTVRRTASGWSTSTTAGAYRSRNVIVASGYNAIPNLPEWPGQERFRGRIQHSRDYRNGNAFKGQRVLVVGFGNSGGEIAIDLQDYGAEVSMAVRSPVNIVPRDILGIPITAVSILLSRLPLSVSDALSGPISRIAIGDLRKLGLKKLQMGPISQIRTRGRIPLIDIGTLKLIRDGKIRILGAVQSLSEDAVTFEDGSVHPFDAIILATGYRPGLERFLAAGTDMHTPGLYLCGFKVTPTGMFREIGFEARRIADEIAQAHARRA